MYVPEAVLIRVGHGATKPHFVWIDNKSFTKLIQRQPNLIISKTVEWKRFHDQKIKKKCHSIAQADLWG